MVRHPIVSFLAGLALVVSASVLVGSNDSSIQKLRLEKFVLPEFPEFVRATGTTSGVVTAAIGRDAEGLVNDVLVLDSTHARFTQAVIDAVKEWKFARPSNVQPPGDTIVPIVRFFFSTQGVTAVSAFAGLAARGKTGERTESSPVVLPSFADLDEVPKPINYPMPKLSGATTGQLKGQSATVKFFVDETGKVRVPIVLECTSRELGLAALAAVEQWRYEPPRMAGRPTIAIEISTITFDKPKS